MNKKQNQPVNLDVDDVPEVTDQQESPIEVSAQKEQPRPSPDFIGPMPATIGPKVKDGQYCMEHQREMIADYTKPGVATFYECRVDGCKAKAVQMHPKVPLRKDPWLCPVCKDEKGKQCSDMVLDNTYKDTFNMKMVCPVCGWLTSPTPKPDAFLKAEAIQREPDIMDTASRRGLS